jgi:hypothetical protein
MGWQMLNQFERKVLHHDLVLHPVPSNANDVFLSDILTLFLAEVLNTKCKWQRDLGQRVYSIQEFREIDGFLVLLLNVSDLDASDPSVQHSDTLVVRSMNKGPLEGASYSAMAVIDTQIDRQNGPKYRLFLEEAPGLSKSYLAPFLTHAVRQIKVEQLLPSGAHARTRASFAIDAHLSETLARDLETGVLSSIELVSREVVGGEFDDIPHLEEQTKTIRLNVTENVSGHVAIDIINRFKALARRTATQQLRIKYRNERKNDKTCEILLDGLDAGDSAVTKSDIVRVQESRPQCETRINDLALGELLDIARRAR